ncbi:type II secretion system F family protein [Paenibacillus pasadenensis]|uniref:Type II/IV secretion system protein TadC, associated with Flp pilus assembly n=1 Tax=Paenibacillus pasadenensis TaxID=217090 RepID=A0A2N5N3P3_9BACL|nr:MULTISPECIES: type II secretion system F family protein [Paenibacillus]PLT44965.1 Type II/IV secretion system protein TadC, associated with Flp pilus assembly [Paenibacillus pasadenensis]QGG55398.1 type II secretion system protein [Paenibacillus sp. B01]
MGYGWGFATMALAWIAMAAATLGWRKAWNTAWSAMRTRDRERIGRLFGGEALLRLAARHGMPQAAEDRIAALHALLVPLRGESWTAVDTRRLAASAVAGGYAAATGGWLVAAAAGEPLIAWLGVFAGLALPAGKIRDIKAKAKRRKQELLLGLPDLLGKLTLLVGAGETVQRALARCAERPPRGRADDPLHLELARTVQLLASGHPFSAALESFSRRCSVQEASVFATVLLLNHRRGGDQLSLALKEISIPLWDKRRSAARARGEEASSRLVFPLVGIFFILMMLVGAPAILFMGG